MTINQKLTQIALVLGAALPVASFAGDSGTLYTQIGTGGLGLGYGVSVAKDWALRGQFNALPSQSFNGSVGDFGTSNLDVKVDWNSLNLLADWYPTDNSFRVTGGITFNNSKVKISGSGSVDGVAATDINSEVKVSDTIAPYLGVGYGTRPKDAKGWGFSLDLGVSFNNPKVSLTATGVSQANIDNQIKKVEDALKSFKTLPVFGIGVSYSF